LVARRRRACHSFRLPQLRNLEKRMPLCDSCGRTVDAEHIRRRIMRLEQSTRFRPIHIHALVIDACPPAEPADFFYNVASDRPERSTAAGEYFGDLALCAPDAAAKSGPAAANEEAVLTEWQRRGLFLGFPVECPYDSKSEVAERIRATEKTLLLRLQTSYKPKFVALLSDSTTGLIETLRGNGWGERLILDGNKPFAGVGLGDRLSKALARV